MSSPRTVELVTPASDVGAVRTLDLRSADAFAAGRPAGAVRLDAALLNRAAPPSAGLLPDRDAARRIVRAAGLRPGEPVVALDAGRATEAARAVWVLHAWGLVEARWLDGGFPAWTAAGLPVERGAPDPDALAAGAGGGAPDDAGLAPVELVAGNLVTADDLHAELGDPRLRVLDVRGAAEYAGTDVRAAAGGHVPGAIHHEWTDQLDASGRALPPERLREIMAALDVRPEHRVVVYCQSHQRSAVTWVLLRHAGFPDVRGLDGAWSVWGNRADLPKATGGPGSGGPG